MVSSFAHQTKSEYYGGNMYVSNEVTELEHFSALHQSSTLLAPDHVSCQAVFHYFSSDIKQDAATTAAHSKHITKMLQKIYIFL